MHCWTKGSVLPASILVGVSLCLLCAGCPVPGLPGGGSSDQKPLGLLFLDPDKYNSIPLATAPLGGTLPPQVDLSPDMPPPGDQGKQQNSCVAWALGYAVRTYQERVKQGWDVSTPSHQFSPAYLYNQTKVGDCTAFTHVVDAMNVLTAQGCCTLDVMPYDPSSCSDQPTDAQKSAAAQYKMADWRRINQLDPSEVKAHLAAKAPVIVGMRVYPDFDDLVLQLRIADFCR